MQRLGSELSTRRLVDSTVPMDNFFIPLAREINTLYTGCRVRPGLQTDRTGDDYRILYILIRAVILYGTQIVSKHFAHTSLPSTNLEDM